MSKLPYMQFYPADFLVDTQTLRTDIAGAWILLLCLIWLKSKNGTIKMSNNELANLWKVDDISVQEDIASMVASNLFDHVYDEKTECNIITSRRISRDRKRLEMKASWVSRQRVDKIKTKSRHDVDPKNQISEVRSQNKDKDFRPNDTLDEFEKFWEAYPRKVGKGAAKKSWVKSIKLALPSLIIDSVYKQRKGFNYEDNKKFIPMPSTWLNQERWLDEARDPSPGNHVASPQPKFDLEKAREIEALKQKEWDRLHPIEALEPDEVPF